MAVALDAQLPDAELARLLADSRCRRLFTTRRHAERLATLAPVAGLQLVLLDEAPGADGAPWSGLVERGPAPLPAIAPEAPALLLYTSGTTGAPKGVPLSHANLLANATALEAESLAGPDDRVLLPLPLHHAYPFTVGVLGSLLGGSSLLLPAAVSGPALAAALREATVLLAVPRLLEALLQAVEARLGPWQRRLLGLCVWSRRRLGLPLGQRLLAPLRRAVAPRLRLVASGGARLDEAVEWSLRALGWQVLTGYGLTETAPMLTFNLPGRSRVGSAGRPLPGVELRIARPDDGGVGEIEARGPNIFRGYWQRPELTRAAFTADGRFRTGDLGWLDRDGYLHVVRRATELIVLPSGEKLLPEEVEAVYEDSAIVREVAVLEQDGTLVALVVPEEEALRARGGLRVEAQLRDELDRLGRRLRSFQRVSRIAVTAQRLPRTPIGKLQRFRLPALWQEAAARRRDAPPAEPDEADRRLLEEPLAAAVWAWLRGRFAERPLGLDDSLQLDLGLDSLAWVGLTLEIEQRFGRSLDEAAVGRILTLRDLLREVREAPATAGAGHPLPPAARTGPAGLPALGLALHLLDRLLMALVFRLQVEGRSNLPARGPFLLVPNHASYLDPLALAAALPLRHLRALHWAGWTGLLFATPLMRLVSRSCQVFPIEPRTGGLGGIAAARTLLARRRVVVWFAEGRRSPDGGLQPFSPGIGLLVAGTGVAAVPVRIEGSFEAWPRWRRLPRPRRIVVTFGRPLSRGELGPAGDDEGTHRQIAGRLHEAVAALGASAQSRPIS